jgi:hypothetical protein
MAATVQDFGSRELWNIYSALIEIYNNTTILNVSLADSENHIGQIGGTTKIVKGSFSRPANTTAYAVNDIVSDNFVQVIKPSARIVGGTGYITGFKLVTNKVITPRFRVHFGKSLDFFTTFTDNVVNNPVYSDLTNPNYLGYVDLPALSSGGNTTCAISMDNTQRIPFASTDSNIELYFMFETLDAFTPDASQQFTLSIATEQN